MQLVPRPKPGLNGPLLRLSAVPSFGGCLGSRTHTVQVLPGYSRLLSPHEVVQPVCVERMRGLEPLQLGWKPSAWTSHDTRAHKYTSKLLKKDLPSPCGGGPATVDIGNWFAA